MKNTTKLTLCFLFVLPACGDNNDDTTLLFNMTSFDANKEKWTTSNIKDYVFDYDESKYADAVEDHFIDVTVQNGAVVSATAEYEDMSTAPFHHVELVPNVELLFAEIETQKEQADKIDVTYDPMYGYPSRAVFYISKTGEGSWSFDITNFKLPEAEE